MVDRFTRVSNLNLRNLRFLSEKNFRSRLNRFKILNQFCFCFMICSESHCLYTGLTIFV